MKKYTSKIIVVVTAVALLGGGFWVVSSKKDDPVNTNTIAIESVKSITFSEDKKTVSYDGQTGKSALELLKSLTSVETQSSDFGDFVTAINGLSVDSSKEYWSFYVNGAYANEGAGTYQTKNDEKIEWRLEKL